MHKAAGKESTWRGRVERDGGGETVAGPAANAVCNTHSIIADKVGVLADGDCEGGIVGVK
jgi:hypothetical protein